MIVVEECIDNFMLLLWIKVFIHYVLIHNNHFIRQTGNLKARDCISNFMMIKWKNNFWIILRISWKIVFHRRDSMTICLLAETYNEWQWKCNVSYFYERHSFFMIINIQKGASFLIKESNIIGHVKSKDSIS